MIKVALRADRGEKRLIAMVRGHGERAVCAAVSALVVTCANSVAALTSAKIRGKGGKSGFLSFSVTNADEKAELLFESLKMGLTAIAAKYPNDLTIKTV